MNFRKVNNITGWVVFLIAAVTYTITREATGSFWDCGEFIACAYKQEIPHPPGSPFFSMMGKLFIVLFSGGNPENVASSVNLLSALASAATILFLFWSITHFARKMFVKAGENLDSQQLIVTMAAGAVGALAYTFSDTFWFSAVEGEVYALSSFFTALIIWAMLKWEHADELATDATDKAKVDRWIVFIFFMIGLAVTVHLLNLLTIPPIVMIYYYRRYNYSVRGGIFAFILSGLITGLALWIFIYLLPRWSAGMDRIFVNSFGLPFFSGFSFFFALLGLLSWAGLRYAGKKGIHLLRLGIWCFLFILMGFSTYVTTLIRSNANPVIDMANVDNPMSLASYFGREQYGSAPLLYGPTFESQPVDVKETRMRYRKDSTQYKELGKDFEYVYDSKDKMIFPRVWDASNDQYHFDTYVDWLDLEVKARQLSVITGVTPGVGVQTQNEQGQPDFYEVGENAQITVQKGAVVRPGDRIAVKKPTYGDNIEWFMSYQMGMMYWRYLLWNFSGRQNDLQASGNKRDANWITGISFIDNARLGDQSKLPESLKENQANNKLFLLPFILGILGCVYQFLFHRKDWLVTFLLFFFTGIAIVLYLNQPGNQPRERDYAYVGSFYAFAIWIGLSLVGFYRLIKEHKEKQKDLVATLTYGSILTFLIILMAGAPGSGGSMLISAVMSTALFAAVSTILYFLFNALSGNGKALTGSLAVVGLAIPLLMASQEWDDHDRGKKDLARETARNTLESCPKDAILFTFGDNDTYPLWYAQEVENIRPDVRIVNNSLLGIDWYINQLRNAVNGSKALDVVFSVDDIEGNKRNYLRFRPELNQEVYNDLDTVLQALRLPKYEQYYPVRKFKVPVDTAKVKANGTLLPTDPVMTELRLEIQEGKPITKSDLIILALIASNDWNRPICFTAPYPDLGFYQNLRKEGTVYRLIPKMVEAPQANWATEQAMRENYLGGTQIRENNTDSMYSRLMNIFGAGSLNQPGIYLDEVNRRELLGMRNAFAEMAGNLADKGRKEDGRKLLTKFESMVNPANLPYAAAAHYNAHNQSSLIYMEAAYKTGDTVLAEKVRKALVKDLDEQEKYYTYLKNSKPEFYTGLRTEEAINNSLKEVLNTVLLRYDPAKATKSTLPQLPAIPQPGGAGQDTIPKDTGKIN
ncbi:MAG: DUF2723 domain-containing protein [Chitinophagaceae bacterium]|nr:DUF2723 domain-containing protein [Chitinophagaceae bacterium]